MFLSSSIYFCIYLSTNICLPSPISMYLSLSISVLTCLILVYFFYLHIHIYIYIYHYLCIHYLVVFGLFYLYLFPLSCIYIPLSGSICLYLHTSLYISISLCLYLSLPLFANVSVSLHLSYTTHGNHRSLINSVLNRAGARLLYPRPCVWRAQQHEDQNRWQDQL